MKKVKSVFVLTLYFFGGLSLFKYIFCIVRNDSCNIQIFENLFIALFISFCWIFIYPKKSLTDDNNA